MVSLHLNHIVLNLLGAPLFFLHDLPEIAVFGLSLYAELLNLLEFLSQLLEGRLKELALPLKLENLALYVLLQHVLRRPTVVLVAVIVFRTPLHGAEGRLDFEQLLALGLVGLLTSAVFCDLDAQLLKVSRLFMLCHDLQLVQRTDGESIYWLLWWD